jgi:hypothetical protein
MQLSHSDLKHTLQASSMGIGRFMPKLFKDIMSVVPLTIIEEFNSFLKAGDLPEAPRPSTFCHLFGRQFA